MENTAVLIERHQPHCGADSENIKSATAVGITLFSPGYQPINGPFGDAIAGNGQ